MNKEQTPVQQTEIGQDEPRSTEEVLAQLRARLMQSGHKTLKEEYGSPRRGVAGVVDKPFVIDRATRDALIQEDPKSSALLKPYVDVQNIKKWRIESQELWLINIPPGSLNIDDYPAIKRYLTPFKEQLEKRGSGQKWYELRQDRAEDAAYMGQGKIAYVETSDDPTFSLDNSGSFYAESGYFLPVEDYFLTGLLNSRLHWFLLGGMTSTSVGGVQQLFAEHLEALPIPMPSLDDRGLIGRISDYCHRTVAERRDLYQHVCQEIATYLAPGGLVAELSPTLQKWHVLDVAVLRAEASRHFGVDIPEDMLGMWGDLLHSGREQLNILNLEITRSEHTIDLQVYEMYALTEEEIEHLDKFST